MSGVPIDVESYVHLVIKILVIIVPVFCVRRVVYGHAQTNVRLEALR
jgi:hypothetical protein